MNYNDLTTSPFRDEVYKYPVDTFNTDVARGTLNKLKKRTTNISMVFNTLFKNPNSPSSSHCNFVLPHPVKNVVSVKLAYIEIPNNSIYLFNESDGSNSFFIREYTTGYNSLIKIPEGQYTADDLELTIQNTINLTLSGGDITYNHFIVVIDPYSNRTIIKNNVSDFDIKFVTQSTGSIVYKNIGWLLGFRKLEYTKTNGYVSESLFDGSCPYLFFTLNDFSITTSRNMIASFQDSYIDKHILAKINPCGDECTELCNTVKREYFGPIDISKIEVKLLNKYGDIVNLNMMDYSFTLDLEVVYDI